MRHARNALLRAVVLLATLLPAVSHAGAGTRSVSLVPMPREVSLEPGSASLGPAWTIRSTGSGEDERAVRLLAQEAAQLHGWTWGGATPGRTLRTIELRAIAAPAHAPALFAEQGYRLTVAPGRVLIEGVSAVGRFYGVQTFRQLLRAHPDGAVPCMVIEDRPALAWRGISDDISRGQVSTLADFKAIIRQLAYYKINLYQLYIEDTFQFEGTPAGVAGRGALTRNDLAQLVAEGRRHHVVVSPIFETLAHQERLLAVKAHRRYGAPAPASFSTRDPRALSFVQSLVDQIASVTRGPFFHIGGDEWQPEAAPAGVNSAGPRAYGRYLGQVASRLRARHGCRAMVYGDVILSHPDAAQDLPRDVVVVDWHYDPQDSFPSLRRLADMGFRDVIVSPGLWSWRTFHPNYARAFPNIASFAQAGKRAGAIGCITAGWGDDGAENLRENNWVGYAFGAAAAWEDVAPSRDPFLRRFVLAHFGVDSEQLARAERLVGWQEFEATGWTGRLYHRPLIVRERPRPSMERMRALEADMLQVERDLAAGEGTVRFHADRLAAMRLDARRFRYMADRERFLDAVGRELVGRTAAQLPAAERARIVRGFAGLEATADGLVSEYGRLWRTHNRPEGLAANEQRLARQGTMLRRLRALAQDGSLAVDDSYARRQALGGAPEPAESETVRR